LISQGQEKEEGNDGDGDDDGTSKPNFTCQEKSSTIDIEPPHPDRPDSLSADILKEGKSLIPLFKAEAVKRLKDIERAEDAADEAIIRLGTNIKSFLVKTVQEAVKIVPPTEFVDEKNKLNQDGKTTVLFESHDANGKKVIHTNRLDAHLHVIHCAPDGFLTDPTGLDYEAWAKEFDVGEKSDEIKRDLEKYEELKKAMEKIVPEQVDYQTFWKRYYFMKHVIELEEQRRKELLKGKIIDFY